MTLQEEITRRRTFAVIAHPDAGKTTLTEKLLLFGGAIHVAGAVKSNKIKKGATSDFMEIERQRGISVATSVMGFEYQGAKINILLSELYDQGLMEAVSVEQTSVFAAAEYFARIEGILPAPESSHAIKVAMDEALKCKETGEEKVIVFGLTGTGYFDMFAYERFHDGKMSDYAPSDEELEASFARLPKVDK